MNIENDLIRLAVAADGKTLRFTDRRAGTEYCTPGAPFAWAKRNGKDSPATAAAFADGRLTVQFGATGATAAFRVTARPRYLVVEVLEVTGEVDELTFADVPLTLKGAVGEPFAAAALALNVRTRVPEMPRPNSRLHAFAYARLGFAGTKVALVGCRPEEMRKLFQEVVTEADELPHSPIGGPWAWDGPQNRGSYLFNFADMSEEKVDEWIRVAKSLGITQIDFHGGTSFRFGDFQPNPVTYPRGAASMKAVLDKLHAAGILAGLHTYAMFMAKTCPYVTPVPHPNLGKLATFTLADDLPAAATAVPVVETTEKVSAITGFNVRNSVTLQIDDELITFTGASKEAPFTFTGCRRGANGTKVAAHARGAKVHHLRECFGLFVPEGDSPLFTEVAAKTAQLYNEAGFDMIYLDALDGGDAVAGREWYWHYEAKFTYEIWKRLKRPAIMEMSTFHHHLWYVRSRANAWDHPTRSYKHFVDIHCASNDTYGRMFLPGHLGWWAFKTWQGADGEPTFADDIEYLCAKALATDTGLSIMGIDPNTAHRVPALPRLAAIMRRYESLRHANYFTDAVKEKVRVPGDEFTLAQSPAGEWQFAPVRYDRHKSTVVLPNNSDSWKVTNGHEAQPLQIRIEALMSAGAYDAPGNVTLADWSAPGEFAGPAAAPGTTWKCEPSTAQVKAGAASGCLTASSTLKVRRGSWASAVKTFTPPANLAQHRALGVWVYGDGKGEVLNLQLRSPYHLSHGIADHYVTVDFTGWRYFELVEPEGKRHADYAWPYGDIYSMYREFINYGAVDRFTLFVNNVPAGESVTTYVSPVRALPLVKAKLRNPALTVGGKTITFPVEMESGTVLELRGGECTLYGPAGEELATVQPQGEIPTLAPGENEVRFTCEAPAGVNPRAYVTVITRGQAFGGMNPRDKVRWELLRREEDDPRMVRALDGKQNRWETLSRANAALEAEVTVEAMGAPGGAYDAADALALESFDTLDGFADGPANAYLKYVEAGPIKNVATSPGITHQLELSRDVVKTGKASARYTATSAGPSGWSSRGKRFAPLLNLAGYTHVGFWLHGDGQGETLYLQLRDKAGAYHDLRALVDFTGWKYIEVPLAGAKMDLAQVEYLILYYNAIPAGKTVTCHLGAVRALRDLRTLSRPTLALGRRKVEFPVELAAGERLAYAGGECKVYGVNGALRTTVKPSGALPALKAGRNVVTFGAAGGAPTALKVRVSLAKEYR